MGRRVAPRDRAPLIESRDAWPHRSAPPTETALQRPIPGCPGRLPLAIARSWRTTGGTHLSQLPGPPRLHVPGPESATGRPATWRPLPHRSRSGPAGPRHRGSGRTCSPSGPRKRGACGERRGPAGPSAFRRRVGNPRPPNRRRHQGRRLRSGAAGGSRLRSGGRGSRGLAGHPGAGGRSSRRRAGRGVRGSPFAAQSRDRPRDPCLLLRGRPRGGLPHSARRGTTSTGSASGRVPRDAPTSTWCSRTATNCSRRACRRMRSKTRGSAPGASRRFTPTAGRVPGWGATGRWWWRGRTAEGFAPQVGAVLPGGAAAAALYADRVARGFAALAGRDAGRRPALRGAPFPTRPGGRPWRAGP